MLGLALVLTVCLMLLVGAGTWVFWSGRTDLQKTKQLVQAKESNPDEQEHQAEAPKERNPQAPTEPESGLLCAAPSPQDLLSSEPKVPLTPANPMGLRVPDALPLTALDPPKPVANPVTLKEKDNPQLGAKAPPEEPRAMRLVWKLKEGDTFYQELIVTQKPNFSIGGLPITLLLQYRIVSRFTVLKVNADGSLVVQQKVEKAKLLEADELTGAAIAEMVARLPGTTFTLHLSPKMDVTKFEAASLPPGVVPLAGGKGMQMVSLLDRDGWKELAQATFFQMDQPLKANARWSKGLTHHWGSLGSWDGQVKYTYLGKEGAHHKIGYGLQLAYKAPKAGAAIGGMQILGAEFRAPDAAGVLVFDAVRGKVVAAEERFRVKGVLTTSILGEKTAIEIDEDQHFLIRIHEKLIP
jgi:hypothetical protein